MKKFYMFFAVVAALFAATTAKAVSTATPILSEDEYRVGAGDIETAFSIDPSIIRGSAGDNETISMKVGLNYFMTDIWAPGLEMDLDAGNGTMFRLLPNIKAYLPTDSRFLPYVQAGFGFEHAVGSNFAAFSIGPGVNYLLSNSVAIGAQLRYDLGAGSNTLHVISMPIQFAIYFKY